jgi:hypothetical protein
MTILTALLGVGPRTIPGLVRKVIILTPTTPGVVKYGWWYVPDTEFWVYNTVGLALAVGGIFLTRRQGRPITSLIAFGLNALAAVFGYFLAMTDRIPG